MKKNFILTIVLALTGIFYSCEKDNLDYAPNASFSGEIRDLETGELVQQDILDSRIYFTELGWDNAPIQQMVVKNDGTFNNNLMFAGDYELFLGKGNFYPLETIHYKMKTGSNKHTFNVVPYLRVLEPEIKFRDGKVVARFKLKQSTSNTVKSIALFAHPDISVGYRIQTALVVIELNTNAEEGAVYEVIMDISKFDKIKRNNSYYFRIGALSNAPEAKYNFSPPVNIDL